MPSSEDPGGFDERHPRLTNASTGLPQVGGIQCPWNRDASGPAKQRIHCMVWADQADFERWAPEGNFSTCRALCMYGRNPEYARRARDARQGFQARAWQRARYAQRIQRLRLRDRFGRVI